MSDIFDHALEAFDRMPEGEDEVEDSGWTCKTCGRWHPNSHKECFFCKNSMFTETNV